MMNVCGTAFIHVLQNTRFLLKFKYKPPWANFVCTYFPDRPVAIFEAEGYFYRILLGTCSAGGMCKQLKPKTASNGNCCAIRVLAKELYIYVREMEEEWAQKSLCPPPRNRWRTSRTHRRYGPDCLHINACVLCSNNALFSKTTWQHSDRGIHFCYTKSVPFSTEHKPVLRQSYLPHNASADIFLLRPIIICGLWQSRVWHVEGHHSSNSQNRKY